MEPKAASLLTPEARLMLRDVADAMAATDFYAFFDRRSPARVCGRQRAQAGRGGPAAARGANRQHGQPRDRRHVGGAWQGGGFGQAGGSRLSLKIRGL